MKRLAFLLLTAFVAVSLVSCKVKDGQADGNPPDSDNSDPSLDSSVTRQIVISDTDVDSAALLETLKPYISGVKTVSDEAQSADCELIIGKSTRALSATAYRRLEMMLEEVSGYAGYVIYSKSGSVAVAYSSSLARRYALSALREICASGDIFAKPDGVLKEEKLYIEDGVDEIREAEREAGFLQLESVIGKSATDSIRSLYRFYDKELYYWLADLYDPENGGFYYSNSARNTIGYLPDIESTVQALMFLETSGLLTAYGNDYATAFENYPEIKEKLISFAKGLQSPVDGYFYHPQWEGEKLSDSRLGRDLDFATSLLNTFGEKPLYDTPNGIEGESPIGGVSPAAFTAKLGESTAFAVSKVIAVSNSGLPAHLQSLDNFKKYVVSLNVETDSYSAGNTLASQYGQIKMAGDEYVDYLINYLNSIQRSDIGLWEDEVSYSSVNGLMKVGGIYNYYDLPIPNIDAALESTLTILKNPSLTAFSIYDEHVCSVYNPWVVIRYLLDSAKDTMGKEKVKEMRAYVISEADELLAVTLDKVALFKRDNGGFSYLKNSTSGTSQGAPVAVSGSVESDVNATTIMSGSIVYNIFYAFGVDRIPLYCKEDGDLFFEALLSLEEIIKDPPKPVEAVKFDDYEDGTPENGIVEYPANGVSFTIGDYEMDKDGKYKWFAAEVVKNPSSDAAAGDLVLKTTTYLYPDEAKSVPVQPSYTKFNMGVTDKGGNCHVFDADLMFKSGTSAVAQIFFFAQGGNVFSLNVVAYSVGENKFIKIGENYEGLDGVKNNEIAKLIPFDEWFNLRIELYKEYSDDGTLSIIGKIYVNGVYAGECDAGDTVDGKFIDKKISGVSIQHYRHSATELYFNNVKCEQLNKEYFSEEKEQETPADNRVADFESGEYGTPYLTNYVCSGSSAYNVEDKDLLGAGFVAITEYSVVSDPKNSANKVLRAYCTGEKTHSAGFTKLLVSNEEPKGNVYVFETKMYLESATWTGDVTQIHFVDRSITNLVSFRIYTAQGSDTFAIYQNNSDGSGSGEIVSDLPRCEWIALRIEWYQGDSAENTRAKLYIAVSDGKAECVADIAAYRTSAFTSQLSQVRIAHQRTNESTVYFDDIALSQIDKEYVFEGDVTPDVPETPEIPDTPSTPTEKNNAASFEDGYLSTSYVKNYFFNSGSAILAENSADYQPITKYSIENDPKGAANRVLKVVCTGETTQTAGFTRLNVSNENPTGKTYIFETRIYLESATWTGDVTQIHFVDSSITNLVSFRIYTAQGSDTFSIYQNNSDGSGTGLIASDLPRCEWVTLRIEWYQGDSAENTFAKIYAGVGDGAMECVGDLPAYRTAVFTGTLSQVRVAHQRTNASTVYFDDISLTQIDKAHSVE